MDITTTRGRGRTRTVPRPIAASRRDLRRAEDGAGFAGRGRRTSRRCPWRVRARVPRPAGRRAPGRRRPRGPGCGRACRSTGPSPSPPSVHSTGTTASAPGGSGAPVMMRAAWPGPTWSRSAWPAATSPTTSRTAGNSSLAPATSATRTAYPSMELLSKGGRETGTVTSSTRTQPWASSSCSSMGSRGRTVREDVLQVLVHRPDGGPGPSGAGARRLLNVATSPRLRNCEARSGSPGPGLHVRMRV